MKEGKILLFLVYILFGLYFINYSIEFYQIPDFVSEFNKGLFLIGGVLIIFGGISHLRHRKKKKILSIS